MVQSLSTAAVQRLLRGEIDNQVVATLLFFIGLSSLMVHAARRPRTDHSLTSFGVLALLLAFRVMVYSFTARFLVGGSAAVWDTAGRAVTYLIPVPGLLFFEEIIGPGWRRSIRAGVWGLGGFAAVAIPLLIAGLSSEVLDLVFIALVALSQVGVVMTLLRPFKGLARDRAVFVVGYVLLGIVILSGELQDIGITSEAYRIGEHLGFFAFVILLGFVVQDRFFRNERRLVALEEEMNAARTIQRAILPRSTPQVEGLEVMVRLIPAEAVAGDLYGFHIPEGGGLGIFVADVTGHGMPAALVASMAHVAFSENAPTTSDPGELLVRINRMLLPEISTTFLTSCFARLDPVGHVMQYASAGHPPMLLLRAGSGAPEWLQAQGVPIGAIPDPGYRTQEIPLMPGDRLIMYTDGLTEAGDPDTGLFDYQGVERYVRDDTETSLERFADGLLYEAARFDGHPGDLSRFRDDLTLIVVQVS